MTILLMMLLLLVVESYGLKRYYGLGVVFVYVGKMVLELISPDFQSFGCLVQCDSKKIYIYRRIFGYI